MADITKINLKGTELDIKDAGAARASTTYTKTEVDTALAAKQAALVSGTNIKTVNNESLLGSGNLTIQGEKGDKGDTGNVQVDGNGNVLIVNDLTSGGTGAALSAEMGKRLALGTGTFNAAWARSKADNSQFCWILNDTVSSSTIRKPIWHIGSSVFIDAAGAVISIEASAVPNSPTFTGASSGDTVAKNSQITVTPATDSVLYYRIGSTGDYSVSDRAVTLTLDTAGSVTISAYCANNKGNSSTATLSLTVQGTPVPVFSAASGTTIDANDVVSRGGYVVITGEVGGTLHYKVGSASSYTDVAGVGSAAPTATVQITGATTIKAYNTVDNDDSSEVTKNYTMATLAAPTMTMSDTTATTNQFPDGGGTVTLSAASGATIYYTTNGDTPTTSATQYSTPISVTSATTIKAIAVDAYGSSSVSETSYTVYVDPKFRFKIALTADNSTEYVPVDAEYVTVDGVSQRNYTMTVDWGDGTSSTYNNQLLSRKNATSGTKCSHAYTGTAGTEFIITIRGSVIPSLVFGGTINSAGNVTSMDNYCNSAALVAILENTLTCESKITFGGANCTSICANALQNNVGNATRFPKGLLTMADGVLSHLSKNTITLCSYMFDGCTSLVLTASQMQELRSSIGSVTMFNRMFYDFKGTCDIPDNFFDNVADGTVTSFMTMVDSTDNGASCTVTGDSSVLTTAINRIKASGATTTAMLRGLKARS